MDRTPGQARPGQARAKCPSIGRTEESGGRVLLVGGMCYLNEWPKSFLRAFIRHYSHHQVRLWASS